MNWSTLKSLGYGGLIPFIGLGLSVHFTHDPNLQGLLLKANALYGASIVSFLGAIHWGIALCSRCNAAPRFGHNAGLEITRTGLGHRTVADGMVRLHAAAQQGCMRHPCAVSGNRLVR
jgi:hypothetical protein